MCLPLQQGREGAALEPIGTGDAGPLDLYRGLDHPLGGAVGKGSAIAGIPVYTENLYVAELPVVCVEYPELGASTPISLAMML